MTNTAIKPYLSPNIDLTSLETRERQEPLTLAIEETLSLQTPPAASDEKLLRQGFLESKAIDETGHITKVFKPLTSLTAADTKRLSNDLAQVHTFSRGGLSSTFSIKSLLCSIRNEFGPFIKSIELVGGDVNCYLGREFLEDNLNINDLSHLKGFLSDALIERLNAPSSDVDIRIVLNDNVHQFKQERLKDGLKGLQESMRRRLCSFISSNMQYEIDPTAVWNGIFKKKGFLSSGSSSLYSLKTNEGFRFDLAVCHDLERAYLFDNDGMAIVLDPILDNTNAPDSRTFAPLNTHERNGWITLLAKLLRDLGITTPETTNILAFPLSCMKRVKGFTSHAIDPDHALLTRYTELLKEAPPPKEKRNAQTTPSQDRKALKPLPHATVEQYPDVIYDQFTHCVRNHLRKDSLGAFFLAFSLCQSLETKFPPPDKLVPQLFNKMANYLEKLSEKAPFEEFTAAIIKACTKGGLTFNSIAHILSLQCLLHDMAGIAIDEKVRLSTTILAGQLHIQLNCKDRSLSLPLDPLKSIEIISNLPKPLHKSVLSLLNAFGKDSSSKTPSSILKEAPLDFDELQNRCEKLLENPQAFPLGYKLWIASGNHCRTNLHTPLEYLLNAILESGHEQISDLLKIHDLPDSQKSFLQTLSKVLENAHERSEISTECIYAMISHSDDEIKTIGWKIYNNLLETKNPDRALVTQKLFLKAQNYSTARRFFEKLAPLPEKKIENLQKLWDLSQNGNDPLEKEEAAHIIYQWIMANSGTSRTPSKAILWLNTCDYYLSTDPMKSFLLWKKGCISNAWTSFTPPLRAMYHSYLLKMCPLLPTKESEEVMQALFSNNDRSKEETNALHQVLTQSVDLTNELSLLDLLNHPQKRAFLEKDELLECRLSCLEAKIKSETPQSFKSLETEIKDILKDVEANDDLERLLLIEEAMVSSYDPLLTIPLLLNNAFPDSEKQGLLLDKAIKKLFDAGLSKNITSIAQLVLKMAELTFNDEKLDEELRQKAASHILDLLEGLVKHNFRSNTLTKASHIQWGKSFELLQDSDYLRQLIAFDTLSLTFEAGKEAKAKFFKVMAHSISGNEILQKNLFSLYKNGIAKKWAMNDPVVFEELIFQRTLIHKLNEQKCYDEANALIKRSLNLLDRKTLSTIFSGYLERNEFSQILILIKEIQKSENHQETSLTDITRRLFAKICENSDKKTGEILLKEQSLFSSCQLSSDLAEGIAGFIKNTKDSQDQELLQIAIKLAANYKIESIAVWAPLLLDIHFCNSKPLSAVAFEAYNKQLQEEAFFKSHKASPISLWLTILTRFENTSLPGLLIENPLLPRMIQELTKDKLEQIQATRIILQSAFPANALTRQSTKKAALNLSGTIDKILKLFSDEGLFVQTLSELGPEGLLIKEALIRACLLSGDESYFYKGMQWLSPCSQSTETNVTDLANFAGKCLQEDLKSKTPQYNTSAIKWAFLTLLSFFNKEKDSSKLPLELLKAAPYFSSDIPLIYNVLEIFISWIHGIAKEHPQEDVLLISSFSKQFALNLGSLLIQGLKTPAENKEQWNNFCIGTPLLLNLLENNSPHELLYFPSRDSLSKLKGEFVLMLLNQGIREPTENVIRIAEYQFAQFFEKLLETPHNQWSKLQIQCIEASQDMTINYLLNSTGRTSAAEHYKHYIDLLKIDTQRLPEYKEMMAKKMFALKNVDEESAELITYKIAGLIQDLTYEMSHQRFSQEALLKLLNDFSFSPITYSYDKTIFLENILVQSFFLELFHVALNKRSITQEESKILLKLVMWFDIAEGTNWNSNDIACDPHLQEQERAERAFELIKESIQTNNIHCLLRGLNLFKHFKTSFPSSKRLDPAWDLILAALNPEFIQQLPEKDRSILANTFCEISALPSIKKLTPPRKVTSDRLKKVTSNRLKKVTLELAKFKTNDSELNYETQYSEFSTKSIYPSFYKHAESKEVYELILCEQTAPKDERIKAKERGEFISRWIAIVRSRIVALVDPASAYP